MKILFVILFSLIALNVEARKITLTIPDAFSDSTVFDANYDGSITIRNLTLNYNDSRAYVAPTSKGEYSPGVCTLIHKKFVSEEVGSIFGNQNVITLSSTGKIESAEFYTGEIPRFIDGRMRDTFNNPRPVLTNVICR